MFISVDPLAEKYPSWTPYHYVHNNPINLVDPTGMEADGWGKRGNTWEYKEEITADNYESLGYDKYMGSGNVYSVTNGTADGRYNFSLNANGSVSSQDGTQINFSFNTEGGTTISPSVNRQAQFSDVFSGTKDFISELNSSSEAMQMLGNNSKSLVKYGGYVGKLNTAFDVAEPFVDYSNQKIGFGRATYRSGGALFGAIVGAEIGAQVGTVLGTALGPGYGQAIGITLGTAAGAGIGAGVKGTEQAYDKTSSEVKSGFNQFINQLKANIHRHQ